MRKIVIHTVISLVSSVLEGAAICGFIIARFVISRLIINALWLL